MTTLKVNAIEPEGGTTNLTIGMTGQNVVIGGSGGLKANVFKDAGGNALFTSNGSGTVTGVGLGCVVLISSQTVTNQASISFTSGITSTYKEYKFEWINMNPVTDNQALQFNGSTDGGSNYNVTKTTTFFDTNHSEGGGGANLSYTAGSDLAQSTAFQTLASNVGNAASESTVGELHLFNPASTTYVKHFYSKCNFASADSDRYTQNQHVAGYFNTTTAINAIQFKFASGNFDGTIKMYGIK